MEYLDNEKSFLDDIKNIFHSLKGYHLVEKMKKMIKIVDTNFNSFIVTNLRPCVSNELIVLVKVPTPIKSSSIDRMFFMIIKNNCWYILRCLRVKTMHDLTLVSYKMMRESNNHHQWRKVGGAARFFISHLSIQNRNDNVTWIAVF